jgi:hypothetical protein
MGNYAGHDTLYDLINKIKNRLYDMIPLAETAADLPEPNVDGPFLGVVYNDQTEDTLGPFEELPYTFEDDAYLRADIADTAFFQAVEAFYADRPGLSDQYMFCAKTEIVGVEPNLSIKATMAGTTVVGHYEYDGEGDTYVTDAVAIMVYDGMTISSESQDLTAYIYIPTTFSDEDTGLSLEQGWNKLTLNFSEGQETIEHLDGAPDVNFKGAAIAEVVDADDDKDGETSEEEQAALDAFNALLPDCDVFVSGRGDKSGLYVTDGERPWAQFVRGAPLNLFAQTE